MCRLTYDGWFCLHVEHYLLPWPSSVWAYVPTTPNLLASGSHFSFCSSVACFCMVGINMLSWRPNWLGSLGNITLKVHKNKCIDPLCTYDAALCQAVWQSIIPTLRNLVLSSETNTVQIIIEEMFSWYSPTSELVFLITKCVRYLFYSWANLENDC